MKIFTDIEQGSEEWKKLRSDYFTASTLGDWLIEEPRMALTVDEIKATLTEREIAFDKKALRPALVELLPNDVFVANLEYTARRNDAWESAIETRLGKISNEPEPEWDTWATKRGNELEPDARIAYARRQGLPVIGEGRDAICDSIRQVGFCAHDGDDFGGSPDGLVVHPSSAVIPTCGLSVEDIRNGLELKCHIPRAHIRFWRRGGFREEHAMQCHVNMAASGIREWHLFGYCPEAPSLFEVFKWDETTDKVLAALLRLSEDYWAAYEKFGEGVREEMARASKTKPAEVEAAA